MQKIKCFFNPDAVPTGDHIYVNCSKDNVQTSAPVQSPAVQPAKQKAVATTPTTKTTTTSSAPAKSSGFSLFRFFSGG